MTVIVMIVRVSMSVMIMIIVADKSILISGELG